MELGARHLRRPQLGRQPAAADARSARGGRARRPARPRRVRDRRAPPPRLPGLVARGRARRDRRPHRADPPLERRHGAQLGRPGARVPAVRRASTCSRAAAPRSWPGRGSFIESFPLFGYDLDDYDELFAEKLELLLAIRDHEHVTWSGRHRAPLDDAGVWPRPVQDPLPVWVAVGGTPAVGGPRRARSGLPLTLAIIGGQPERFAPLVDLYREAGERRPATTRPTRRSRSTPTPSSARRRPRPTPRSPRPTCR